MHDPDDRGGRTNYGVTQSTYNTYLKSVGKPKADVKNIAMSEVLEIYEISYWRKSRARWLKWPLNIVMMDISVNHGVGRAYQFLNRALGLPGVLKWLGSTSEKVHKADPRLLAIDMLRQREDFYNRIAKRPGQGKFLKGWMNRLNDLKRTITE